MLHAGLVDEVRKIFIPDADYTKGIRRSISVPEMAKCLREEKNIDGDDESKKMILQTSISSIKRNTLVDETWRNTVLQPCLDIVERFLKNDEHNITKMKIFINNNNKFNKKKVMFIMGATRTGKSSLSVDLATHFRGEIIKSNKIFQLHGRRFLSKVHCLHRIFLKTQCAPIIVGGANSYIEKLVEDPVIMLKHKAISLEPRVDMRVGEMVNACSFCSYFIYESNFGFQIYIHLNKTILKFMLHAGMVDEVRQIFILDADHTKGIRWSIGVTKMAKYLREEKTIDGDDESKKMILQASISSFKRNTRSVHHIIATNVFKEDRKEVVDEAWRNTVLQPCLHIVQIFLKNDDHNISIECTQTIIISILSDPSPIAKSKSKFKSLIFN
ncbi:hypothetical protein H5410_001349, partial [Solanum commersonii]